MLGAADADHGSSDAYALAGGDVHHADAASYHSPSSGSLHAAWARNWLSQERRIISTCLYIYLATYAER